MMSRPQTAPFASRASRNPCKGIVLLLLSGVVVLLLGVSVLFLKASWLFASGAAAGTEAAAAGLASASGMEYAAARLVREAYPRFSSVPVDRGDDLAFREGISAPLAGARNVSYAHGDSWLEGGAPDGRFDPPGDLFDPAANDADGDGRFVGRSGRVRSPGGTHGGSFSLRIVPTGGLLPVNAGDLSQVWQPSLPTVYFDPQVMHAFNNLGALILSPGETKRANVPAGAGGEPIRLSWLGYDLRRRRPLGGYRTPDEVRKALLASGYTAGEADRVLPYLTIHHTEAAVEMATAPLVVLQCLWMYVNGPVLFPPGDPAFRNFWTSRFHSRSGAGNVRYMRPPSPPPPFPMNATDLAGIAMICQIYPDESEALALEAHALRAEGIYAWTALRDRLEQKALSLFPRDLADLDLDGNPATLSFEQAAWARAKAELAFAAVAIDRMEHSPRPASWSAWGAERPAALHLAGWFGRVFYPSTPYALQYAPAERNHPYRWNATLSWLSNPDLVANRIQPLGLSTAPPVWFEVESAGRASPRGAAAWSEGTLRARERLDLYAQEDFEALTESPKALERRGILVVDPAPKEKRAVLPDPANGRRYPQVASYPMTNPSRVPTHGTPGAPGFPASPHEFSRTTGGLALAGREGGLLGAGLYWPFTEDLDGNESNDNRSTPGGIPLPVWRPGMADTAPWWVSTSSNFSINPEFDCPGIDAPPPHLVLGSGPFIEGFSMEGWLSPKSDGGASLRLYEGQGTSRSITILAQRAVESSRTGTRVALEVKWAVDPASNPLVWQLLPATTQWFIPDADPATGEPHPALFHMVASFERIPEPGIPPQPGRTKVRLLVNGEAPPSAPDGWDFGAMFVTLRERLVAVRTGEIRLYAWPLSLADARSRFRLGRFVPPSAPPQGDLLGNPVNPTYRSPRYDLGEGGCMLRTAQWTGILCPDLAPQVGMRVVLYGYRSDGTLAGSLEIPRSTVPSAVDGIGPVRSFRYAVELFSETGSAPSRPLLDTPLLESIWLDFHRPRVTPAWERWGTR